MRLLDPKWIDSPGRFGLGVSWACEVHEDCRVEVFFQNAMDSGSPVLQDKWGRPPLYFRVGSGLGELTIAEWINAGDCFSGRLVDGKLIPGSH